MILLWTDHPYLRVERHKSAADGPITEKKLVFQRHKNHVERMKCPTRMVVKVASCDILAQCLIGLI
jgi:hypothetical protein